MDILAEVRRQFNEIPFMEERHRFEAVLQHLQMAITHYRNGRDKKNPDYFVDTILRSNQVFEGSLKEAYRIVRPDSSLNIPLHKIEEYFKKEGVLGERLSSLVSDYRKTWRNESTHDYSLTFSSGEALMAIMLTSAFLGIFFEQMVIELTKQHTERTVARQPIDAKVPLIQTIETVLRRHLNSSLQLTPERRDTSTRSTRYESQIVEGVILALLEQSGLQVEREVLFASPGEVNRQSRADFIIRRGNEVAVADIASIHRGGVRTIEERLNFLQEFQSRHRIENGILIAFESWYTNADFVSEIFVRSMNNSPIKMLLIAPEKVMKEFVSKQQSTN